MGKFTESIKHHLVIAADRNADGKLDKKDIELVAQRIAENVETNTVRFPWAALFTTALVSAIVSVSLTRLFGC